MGMHVNATWCRGWGASVSMACTAPAPLSFFMATRQLITPSQLCLLLAGVFWMCKASFTNSWTRHHIITPHACARGKVIGLVIVVVFVIVHTKIARSRLLGVLASGQYCHDVENGEKVMSFCFKALNKDHEYYKSCFLIGHAYQPHLLKLISYA